MVRLILDISVRFLDVVVELGEVCAVVWFWAVGCWGGDEVLLVLFGEFLLIILGLEIETGINIGFIVLLICNNKLCIC